MPKIETDISVSGLTRAIKELEQYRDKITLLPSKIVLKLVTDGLGLAKNNANTLVQAEHTDIVANDIYSQVNSNKGKLYTTKPESTYAELGIGIVGKESPHPSIQNWVYDMNNHGQKGWWFPTSDSRYVKKTDKNGQTWGWTRGFISQPYMYETAKQLRLKVSNVARYMLKEE